MDERACPHCGSRFPYVHDAFCPACREPIDEPPVAPRTEEEKAAFLANVDRDARRDLWGFFRMLDMLLKGLGR